jgi:chromosome segregation ATPase
LRETERLKEVGALLREAQKTVDAATSRWPELRNNLAQSAKLLRATQEQMRLALERREEYEAALQQMLKLAETYSAVLPLMTMDLETQLSEQEESLGRLQDSIDHTTAALPAWDRTASNVLSMTRLLLALVAAIAGLHGAFLLISTWSKRPVGL